MARTGRPSKYRRKFAKMIVEFFNVPPNKEVNVTITSKKGNTVEKTELRPNKLPTFQEFADKIKVNGDTIVEWTKQKKKNGKLKYPEFTAAYKKAKELQKWFLIENGLNGLYNPAFAIFTAKNITDMSDKQEIDHTTKGKPIKTIAGFNYIAPEKPHGTDNTDNKTDL